MESNVVYTINVKEPSWSASTYDLVTSAQPHTPTPMSTTPPDCNAPVSSATHGRASTSLALVVAPPRIETRLAATR